MIDLPDNYVKSCARPDLVQYVADHCVRMSEHHLYDEQVAWCEHKFGEQRPGNIIQEAEEGWLDYFDGDWQLMNDPCTSNTQFVIWFANKSDMAAYVLVWS
jgi:hypothetical protein